MKRLFAVIVALIVLALSATALAEGNWYLDVGTSLVRRIQALAVDESYFSLYTNANDDINQLLERIRSADYDAPVSASMIYFPERDAMLRSIGAVLPELEDAEGFDTILNMSDAAMDEVARKLPATLVNLVNARVGGQAWIMLASVLGSFEGYAEPEGFRQCVLMLKYADGSEAAVSFQRIGDGVVTASASLLPEGGADMLDEVISEAVAYGLVLEKESLEI